MDESIGALMSVDSHSLKLSAKVEETAVLDVPVFNCDKLQPKSCPYKYVSCMLGSGDVHVMYVCLSLHAFRLVVVRADLCTPAQTSWPQMNSPIRHAFLVFYGHPNRPHRRQEVSLTACTRTVHDDGV